MTNHRVHRGPKLARKASPRNDRARTTPADQASFNHRGRKAIAPPHPSGQSACDWLSRLRLIGMIHLPPLPGSPGAALAAARGGQAPRIAAIIERAVAEAILLDDAGFDAVIVENYGDAPFVSGGVPAETVAAMAVVVDRVVRGLHEHRRAKARPPCPVGVNVLRNDAVAALAVAAAGGASFIRVNVLCGTYATDQGVIEGRARRVSAERARLCPHVAIAADVHVKHAVPISQPDIALAAQDTAYRAGADALIISGAATGRPADLDAARRVRAAVPDRPVWIGSGVTAATARKALRAASGVIVGTALKQGSQTTAELDAAAVRNFVRAARR